jgi:hypothetical protein
MIYKMFYVLQLGLCNLIKTHKSIICLNKSLELKMKKSFCFQLKIFYCLVYFYVAVIPKIKQLTFMNALIQLSKVRAPYHPMTMIGQKFLKFILKWQQLQLYNKLWKIKSSEEKLFFLIYWILLKTIWWLK